jgi:hypothetical protein
VKAEKILKECFSEEALYKTVLECYTNSNKTLEQLHENMKLLYLLRSHDDEWRAPE